MAKVELDIDVNDFREQFQWLLNWCEYQGYDTRDTPPDALEGLLNLMGGIRDALEKQGISFKLPQEQADKFQITIDDIVGMPKGPERDAAVQKLWDEMEDIPFDFSAEYPDGFLAHDWAGFEAGTDKYDIWHWFDDYSSQGINHLLYPDEKAFSFLDYFGDEQNVYFKVTSYANNQNLAILLFNKGPDSGVFEGYGDLTVNVDDLPPWCAAINANNLGKNVVDSLTHSAIAYEIDQVQSGFYTYPVMKFNPSELSKLDPEGTKKYQQLVENPGVVLSLDNRKRKMEEIESFLEDCNFHDNPNTHDNHGIDIR